MVDICLTVFGAGECFNMKFVKFAEIKKKIIQSLYFCFIYYTYFIINLKFKI